METETTVERKNVLKYPRIPAIFHVVSVTVFARK